jgi:hypothetical protein
LITDAESKKRGHKTSDDFSNVHSPRSISQPTRQIKGPRIMLELNEDSTANAIDRAYEENPRVSLVTPEQDAQLEGARRLLCGRKFHVTCKTPEHPGGHVTRFRRHPADRSLWGECVLAATGDRCPAAIGERVCYHLAVGLSLFLVMEERDRARKPKRVSRAIPEPVLTGRVLGPRESVIGT